MKQTFIKIALLSVTFLLFNTLQSQVLIGDVNSGDKKPVKGALLDIRESHVSNGNIANSNRGVMMPRVALSAKQYTGTNLSSSIEYATSYPEWKLNLHIGLTVYNVTNDRAKNLCPGLYTWDGDNWQKFGEQCFPAVITPVPPTGTAGIDVSPSTLYFPTGVGSSYIPSQQITTTWNPSSNVVYAQLTNSGSLPPLSLQNWNLYETKMLYSSPSVLNITPNPITSIPTSNPFYAQESQIKFTTTISGTTYEKVTTINQTNKELLINGSKTPSNFQANSGTNSISIPVKTNAKYTILYDQTVVSHTNASGATSFGAEVYDGNPLARDYTEIFSYNYNSAPRLTNIIFRDEQAPSRFADVTYTITKCDATKDLTMEEYRDLWLKMYGNYGEDSDGDISKNLNKVRWHRTRSGNIFFSALFGNTRWMVTNMNETTSTKGPMIATEAIVTIDLNKYIYPNTIYLVNSQNNVITPPNGTDYKNFPRLGLLYDLHTAQNVCPTGWRIPTTDDYMVLMAEIDKVPGKHYNSGGTYVSQTDKLRDVCENGYSLPFLEGGFDLPLAGFYAADEGRTLGAPYRQNYKSHIFLWTITDYQPKQVRGFAMSTSHTLDVAGTGITSSTPDGVLAPEVLKREWGASLRCIRSY